MRTHSSRDLVAAAVAVTGLLLAGCADGGAVGRSGASATGDELVTAHDDGFHGTLLDPVPPRPDLVLPTTDGEPFDLSDRPGDEVTVLFFGYTHCPDLCPTTMADLARAHDMVAPAVRDRVRVVFVTEDPARDTPELLREWLDRFHPDFTGLIGGTEATAATLAELYLPESAQVADPSAAIAHPHDEEQGHESDERSHGNYALDHAGTVYAWGPGGRAVIYTGGTTPDQYAEDLTRLATVG